MISSYLGKDSSETDFTLFIYNVTSEHADKNYSKAGSHYSREYDTRKTQFSLTWLTKTNWKTHTESPMFKDYIFITDLELRSRNSDLNLLSAQKMTSILCSKLLKKSNNIAKKLLVLLQESLLDTQLEYLMILSSLWKENERNRC